MTRGVEIHTVVVIKDEALRDHGDEADRWPADHRAFVDRMEYAMRSERCGQAVDDVVDACVCEAGRFFLTRTLVFALRVEMQDSPAGDPADQFHRSAPEVSGEGGGGVHRGESSAAADPFMQPGT